MNVSSGQFGGEDWSRPQAIANPFHTTRGWNADKGIMTGESHPQYEGVDDPLPWKAGTGTALDRMTAWRAPGGAAHTVPAPGSSASYGSTLMGGVGGMNASEIPQATSTWRSASFKE